MSVFAWEPCPCQENPVGGIKMWCPLPESEWYEAHIVTFNGPDDLHGTPGKEIIKHAYKWCRLVRVAAVGFDVENRKTVWGTTPIRFWIGEELIDE